VIADNNLIAGPYYHAVGYPWGPSLATSQVIGGGIIWILGDFVGLPFLAVQLIQMMREDKAEAAAIDAELDAREAARVPEAHEGGDDTSDAERPWWENDPRFTERFKNA
jgi:cytochrome c oxidase assembly factor CtaG